MHQGVFGRESDGQLDSSKSKQVKRTCPIKKIILETVIRASPPLSVLELELIVQQKLLKLAPLSLEKEKQGIEQNIVDLLNGNVLMLEGNSITSQCIRRNICEVVSGEKRLRIKVK